MSPQAYLLPTPDGWALNVFGDPTIEDDAIIPLPLTSRVSYRHALAFAEATPVALDGNGITDGWPSLRSLVQCGERDLAERAGWQV